MRSERTLPARDLLARAGNGFGLVALADLLAGQRRRGRGRADPTARPTPTPSAPPHHSPRAKRCIFLYMPGGPSHIDLFDPKPRVAAMNGQPLPFEKPKLERTKTGNLLASPWKFARSTASAGPR